MKNRFYKKKSQKNNWPTIIEIMDSMKFKGRLNFVWSLAIYCNQKEVLF